MNADPQRKPGFYWVRFEGNNQIAEWTDHGSWIFCGCDLFFSDAEVCEIISGHLEPLKNVTI